MTTEAHLPKPTEIKELLSDMLGKDVEIQETKTRVSPKEAVVALYTTDDGQRIAACVCDMKLAASMSAALTLIPPRAALEAATTKKLSGELSSNLSEVLNIASQLFRQEDAKQRIIFNVMHVPPDELPSDVKSALTKPAQRFNADVTVQGYTSGRLSLMTLPAA